MTSPIMRETDIQKEIISYLKYRGVIHWRNNTGSFARRYWSQKEQKWKETFFRAGAKGAADIIGVLPDGKILCIEVKTQTGKLSPEQKTFLENIKRNNGVAMVARKMEDVVELLGNLGYFQGS